VTPQAAKELYARVSELRSQAFELAQELPRYYSSPQSGHDVTTAAVQLQSVANQLGSVESLLVPQS